MTHKEVIAMVAEMAIPYAYLNKYAAHATKDDKKSTVIWSIKRVIKGRI